MMQQPKSDGGLANYWSVTARDVELVLREQPAPPRGSVRTLADMTPAERRALERQYGAKIARKA